MPPCNPSRPSFSRSLLSIKNAPAFAVYERGVGGEGSGERGKRGKKGGGGGSIPYPLRGERWSRNPSGSSGPGRLVSALRYANNLPFGCPEPRTGGDTALPELEACLPPRFLPSASERVAAKSVSPPPALLFPNPAPGPRPLSLPHLRRYTRRENAADCRCGEHAGSRPCGRRLRIL